MMECVVLNVYQFNFENDQGQKIRGCKVQYLNPESNLNRLDQKGLQIMNITGSYELFEDFTEVPGKYNFNFKVVPGQGGKTNVKLEGAELIERIEIT